MVNSSGSFGFFALAEFAAVDAESQPASANRMVDTAANAANSGQRRSCIVIPKPSWQVPRPHRFLQLFQRGHIGTQRLAISQLPGPITPLAVEKTPPPAVPPL